MKETLMALLIVGCLNAILGGGKSRARVSNFLREGKWQLFLFALSPVEHLKHSDRYVGGFCVQKFPVFVNSHT